MRCVNDDIAKRIGGHSMFIVAAQAVAEQVTGHGGNFSDMNFVSVCGMGLETKAPKLPR